MTCLVGDRVQAFLADIQGVTLDELGEVLDASVLIWQSNARAVDDLAQGFVELARLRALDPIPRELLDEMPLNTI